jgi:translation initiation factor 2 subunit 1
LKLEDLCRTVSWPLYKKYGHAYDAFKLALSTDSDNPVDIFADLEVDEVIKDLILTYVKRRLAPQPGKC